MIVAYPMECEVFGSACEQFQSLVCRLIGEVAGQMEHGPIEALIFKEGTLTPTRHFTKAASTNAITVQAAVSLAQHDKGVGQGTVPKGAQFRVGGGRVAPASTAAKGVTESAVFPTPVPPSMAALPFKWACPPTGK
jgi:hypothetical protein